MMTPSANCAMEPLIVRKTEVVRRIEATDTQKAAASKIQKEIGSHLRRWDGVLEVTQCSRSPCYSRGFGIDKLSRFDFRVSSESASTRSNKTVSIVPPNRRSDSFRRGTASGAVCPGVMIWFARSFNPLSLIASGCSPEGPLPPPFC